jgi:protein TonB
MRIDRAILIALLTLAASHTQAANGPRLPPVSELGGAELLNPRDLFRTYPPKAFRERAEGQVIMAFQILETGRATSCQIERSSGHASLDRGACRLMERKAKFRPAMSQDHRPIATSARLSMEFWLD